MGVETQGLAVEGRGGSIGGAEVLQSQDVRQNRWLLGESIFMFDRPVVWLWLTTRAMGHSGASRRGCARRLGCGSLRPTRRGNLHRKME